MKGQGKAHGKKDGPRLFCIPATNTPLIAVIRRGPSGWSHLGKWDVVRSHYDPGAWIRARIYPQRCDLSPDGRWFCYLALKGTAKWNVGLTYIAISRLPWLTALTAWATCGTWTRGLHFVQDTAVWEAGTPDHGDIAACRRRFGIAVTKPASFAVERRRGWAETPGSPERAPNDMWDEKRADTLRMEKVRPRSGGKIRLMVRGFFAAFRDGQTKDTVYEVVENCKTHWLKDAQWADWDPEGRLLVATTQGRLQIRDWSNGQMFVRSEVDLSLLSPEPLPPPDAAYCW